MKHYLLILMTICCTTVAAYAEEIDTIEIATMLDMERYQEVIQYTSEALAQDSKNGVLYYYRAQAYTRTNQYKLALEDAGQAILYPEDCNQDLNQLYIWRGNLYLQEGQKDKAIEDFTSAISQQPDRAGTYAMRANCYAARMQYRQAAADYRQAWQLAPDMTAYRYQYARMLLLNNQYDAGRSELQDIIHLNPHDTEAALLLATADYQYGHYADAVRHYIVYTNRSWYEHGAADELDLFESASMRDYTATYHILSEEIVRLTEEEDTELRNIYQLVRATCYMQKGYWQDALIDLDAISTLDVVREKNIPVLQRRAYCYLHLHRYDLAVAAYSRLIYLQPEEYSHYAMRAQSYAEWNRYAEAQKDYQYVLQRDTATRHIIARQLGHVQLLQQQYAEAIESFTLSIRTNTESDPLATYYRGRAYLALGDTLTAQEDFEQVLEIDTTTYHSVRHLALYHLEREEEALEWMQAILTAHPEARDYHRAAELMALMGKSEEEERYRKIAQDIETI